MNIKIKETIVLVNDDDQVIGQEEKHLAHKKGLKHRAFSVFVFRDNNGSIELLLQQRQYNKYHCGGLWTNTCCGHPRMGEDIILAGVRRLKEEMGINVKLIEGGVFHYRVEFDNGLTENEIDHVLIGFFNDQPLNINSDEVVDYRWESVASLQKIIKTNANQFTPWFGEALEIAIKSI